MRKLNREEREARTPSTYRKHYSAADAAHYLESKESAGSHRAELRLIDRALRHVGPEEQVLDLPCGAARITLHLLRRGLRVTAADVSAPMIALARQRIDPAGLRAGILVADAENAPFEDRAFDTVLCFRLFHHFPDDELRVRVIRELCRIASRRVILSFFTVRCFTYWKRRWQSFRRGRPMTSYYVPKENVAAWFADEGFRVVDTVARTMRALCLAVAERKARHLSDREPRTVDVEAPRPLVTALPPGHDGPSGLPT